MTSWRWFTMQLRRFQRSQISRICQTCLLLSVAWTFLDALAVQRALTRKQEDPPPLGREKIFIASIHWNNEMILRSHWNDALLEVAEQIGKENVFVSIQESGSWDDSKGALAELRSQLDALEIRNRIILDPTTHIDEISKPPAESGWIWTPRNQMELRRIPYLARLRNLVMEPLYEMQRDGERFDKILFLNDVVFTSVDVRNLIATRDGDYAAACSLDFKEPPRFYDTMALRDSEGHDFLMQTWPFFRSRSSRRALKSNHPVPVASCWNGIVVFDAAPFYDHLAFRGIPDSLGERHIEGSECCLIHADNPLSRTNGVWLNPRVLVAYSGEAYNQIHWHPIWSSTWDIFLAGWKNRMLRWFTTPWFKNQIVNRRLWRWERKSSRNREPGTFCLINEMQVLVYNGWKHL